MGSMMGHTIQGTTFVTLGTWHLVSFFATYMLSPREYTARAWYQVTTKLPWKHLELYLMLLFLPMGIFYDLGISMQHFQQPVLNDDALSIMGFENVTVLFMFWLFALIVLMRDTTAALPFPPEGAFLFASLAFSLEWLSGTQDSAQGYSTDLERQCDRLLAYASAACAISSGLLAIRPKAFVVNLVLCLSLILRGTWQINLALSLFSEHFIPLGCRYTQQTLSDGVTVFSTTQCVVKDADVRAVALMDLAFNCHIIAIVSFSVLIFGLTAKLYGHRGVVYDPPVFDFDSETVQLKTKLSFERR